MNVDFVVDMIEIDRDIAKGLYKGVDDVIDTVIDCVIDTVRHYGSDPDIRHGYWDRFPPTKNRAGWCECSICRAKTDWNDETPFCFACGAWMDKEAEG